MKTKEMFAKLKKKIQEEGGISSGESADKHPSAAIDDGMSTTKSQNLSYIHNSGVSLHFVPVSFCCMQVTSIGDVDLPLTEVP